MPLRNVLHKIGQALHHDDAHHTEKSVEHTAHMNSDRGTLETGFVGHASTEPDLINGSHSITSGTISVNSADSKTAVFVDTTVKATEVLDTTFQTLAPVQDSTVVHETYVREKVEEVQPVIHREIVEPEIHRVVAPVMEHQKKSVMVSEKNLGEIVKETFVEAPSDDVVARLDTPLDISTVDVKASSTTVALQPIVIEHHVKQVIEEIQPVIHRTVEEPELVREKVDIYETVVRAPKVYEESREAIYREVSSTSTVIPPIPGQAFTSAHPISGESVFDTTFTKQSVTDNAYVLPSSKSAF